MRRMSRPIHIPLRVEERLATAHGGARYVSRGFVLYSNGESRRNSFWDDTFFDHDTRCVALHFYVEARKARSYTWLTFGNYDCLQTVRIMLKETSTPCKDLIGCTVAQDPTKHHKCKGRNTCKAVIANSAPATVRCSSSEPSVWRWSGM